MTSRFVTGLRSALVGAARSVDEDIAFGSGWNVGVMPPAKPEPPPATGRR